MLDDFRSRMGDIRQEMDRLANQAEELERVVHEQQVRLEEMDLQVRQRDQQLAEQQAHLEQLQAALQESEQALPGMQARLTEKEQLLARQGEELEELRAQLSQREANETALREELARASLSAAGPSPAELLPPGLIDRFSALEELVRRQGETMAHLSSLLQAQLRQRAAPPEAVPAVPPAVPSARRAAPVAEVKAPAREVAPPAVRVAVPEVLPPAVNPFQASLQEALESFPEARLAGLAGRDGLAVEVVARGTVPADLPIEAELADLTSQAHRVAAALGTGPLLTLAFQSGESGYLVSPIGADYFAFLLVPAGSLEELRRAQAVLLQVASQMSELF